MTRVVTITREYGSGATSIARLLADRLGWRILDHDILAEVLGAAQAALPGTASWHSDLWFRKLVQEVTWNGLAQRLAAGDELPVRAAVMAEAARMGDCVIVGRGAQCILRGYRDVFHVFLRAPLPVRIERTAEMGGDRADLASLLSEHDRSQSEFVRAQFGLDWRDPQLYDLMIDTRHGYRPAAEAICAAAGLHSAAVAY